MRVIAGKVKGHRLEAIEGRDIRPTLDRVRESLFNILAPRLPDACFLDLFAGTGANGIEALSRGAAWCTLVDCASSALDIIRKNLERTRLTASADCRRLQLPGEIGALAKGHGPYDIVFMDPPYDFAQYSEVIDGLQAHALLNEGALVVVEHAATTTLADSVGALTLSRRVRYGDTALSIYS